MLKVINRNTTKRCLLNFKNNINNIRATSPDYQLFAGGNSPEPCLNIYQFAIKSLLSVLLSSSTVHNFNNSRPIYVILWELRNHYRNIWLMKIQNVSIFSFLEKQLRKWTNFSTLYLIFKGRSCQYHKVRHPNFL